MTLRLTELAQSAIQSVARPGDCLLDATAGNGYDTLFLARLAGPKGKVFAFDIQESALQSTAVRLQTQNHLAPVCLILASHERVEAGISGHWQGKLNAAMFNLGFLPKGDKNLVTQPHSTLAGLRQAWDLLAPGGRITLIAYHGHPGGSEEACLIRRWLESHDPERLRFQSLRPRQRQRPPELFILDKLTEPRRETSPAKPPSEQCQAPIPYSPGYQSAC